MMTLRFPLALCVVLSCAVAPGQGSGTPAARPTDSSQGANQVDVEAAVRQFSRLSAQKQEKVLEAARAAIARIDHPLLRSVRVSASTIEREPGSPRAVLPVKRAKAERKRKSRKTPRSESLPFPVRWEYVFGTQEVASRPEPKGSAAKKARVSEMRAMLLGFPPGLDAARAALLRRLDSERAGDSFAKLLETWRSGDESFYEALDRTAGTPEAVFFYDAMLNDFRNQCVPDGHPDKASIRTSMRASHDALHASFLAYRQYRAFREALVLSLLLPPDVALPSRLSKYGEKPASGYSPREILTLLLAHEGNDPKRVVDLVVRTAPALPAALWQGYEPFGAFYAAYQERLPAMIEQHGGTDQLLAKQNETRLALGAEIARAAFSALP